MIILPPSLKMLIREVAELREETGRHSAKSRPMGDDYEYLGVLGEATFSILIGQEPDLRNKQRGDKGIDGYLELDGKTYSYNMKTARRLRKLLRLQNNENWADIYIKGLYSEDRDAVAILGWAWADEMRAAPAKDFGCGRMNHYINDTHLHPISELLNLLTKNKVLDVPPE